MGHDASELIRLRYKYRSMILRGELKLPIDAARQLVGPDCAYHLYHLIGDNTVACKGTGVSDSKKSNS
ncbi:MAG: hypothetical protein QXQ53_08535 [Candidatus Methanosuratincola sp.]